MSVLISFFSITLFLPFNEQLIACSSSQVIFDYDDQMKFPCLREDIRRYTEEEGIKVRC
jgi:hypothetical protein